MKSHFRFSKQERSGIFFLILLIILFQGIHFYLKSRTDYNNDIKVALNEVEQEKIDSLKAIALEKNAFKTYPFNPNFITAYKGYTLGMSLEEIDRLHSFRRTGSYVNSTEQFQEITQISDSLLKIISPYFKFPEWVQRQKEALTDKQYPNTKRMGIQVVDINSASVEDLKRINGIGDKLSARIVKFRDRLGGFLVNEQLYDVYGLEDEVVQRALKRFQVLDPPTIQRININTASVSEIAAQVYIPYKVANNIVQFRQLNGRIKSFDELNSVDGFPSDKLDRIALYLSL